MPVATPSKTKPAAGKTAAKPAAKAATKAKVGKAERR